MKIVREYTFEGPEVWLRACLAKSLPDGDQGFLSGTNKKITVKTTQNELPIVGGTGEEETSDMDYPVECDCGLFGMRYDCRQGECPNCGAKVRRGKQ